MSRRAMAPRDAELLGRIRAAVQEVEPGARVILYGSRARGDTRNRFERALFENGAARFLVALG